MTHSLINPNQLCLFGIDLCDDAYVKHRGLRLIDHKSELRIPFEAAGTTISFQSRYPTQEELDTCQHVTLTSDSNWNPRTVELGINSRSEEEEERSRMLSQFLSQESETYDDRPNLLPFVFLTDCSPTLCPKQMVQRLISKIQVTTTKRVLYWPSPLVKLLTMSLCRSYMSILSAIHLYLQKISVANGALD
jgi:hypothetical protein